MGFCIYKISRNTHDYDDKRISEIRVTLVEKNPNLKFDLTTFRKEIIKHILQEIGAMKEATYHSNEAFNEFLNLGIKSNYTKMQKLLLKDSLEKQRLSNGNADLKIIVDHIFDFSINSKMFSNKPSPDHF